MMPELKVEIEINGRMTAVGTITGTGSADAVFTYAKDYLALPGAKPISLSLPFQTEAFSPAQTANYFEGLLPEGFTRRAVAQWMHASENDYLAILHGLGRECLGAIRVTDDSDPDWAEYDPIPLEEVSRLAGEGAEKSAELVVASHLSLTGASGKVGLYYDEEKGAWYLPRGTAPSTHIVKQSHVRLNSIVINEQLALLAAAYCGINTAGSFIINTGSGKDNEILLASARYDRSFSGSDNTINGLPVPYRLHQEDFAQALGISAGDKYEKPGENHLGRAFNLLRRYSSDPINDQSRLWDLVCFNYLIGNTDGHLKNLSLLYSPDMKTVRLAPAYDLVSTAVYPSCTRDMAFSIGGMLSLDTINLDSFRKAAEDAGIGAAFALKRLNRLCNVFEDALSKAANRLSDLSLPGADELSTKILLSGGFRNL